jgi:Hepatocellular carcinoma-associated antigen 59
MAYIDSELAKRRVESIQALVQSSGSGSLGPGVSGSVRGFEVNGEGKKEVEVQRQPAALGKLQEIDLGDEARSKNVKRTEQARRKLDGEEVEDEASQSGKPGKVRLGRDGKPWRGRKRRGSDDVKRDKLVEEVLRENRCKAFPLLVHEDSFPDLLVVEIYEEPVVEPQVINDDQAADDRIAEAFRKEFMDAVSARQRKKTAPAPPPSRTAGGKKEEEVLKGPKLGGSRSARAAMRETMLKNAKK